MNIEDLLDAVRGRTEGEDMETGGEAGAVGGALAGAGTGAMAARNAGSLVEAGEETPALLKYLAQRGLKGGLAGAALGAGAGAIHHAMQPSRGKRVKRAIFGD